MSSLSDRAKKFIQKYKIEFLSDSKRCLRTTPVTKYFVLESDKDVMQNSAMTYDTEPLITVSIPLSKLEQLANLESMFYNNIDDEYPRQLFQRWVEQQENEHFLRTNYESVRKAYEHYSAMLYWCGKTRNDIKILPPEKDNL